jgi:hypothetical protein
MRHLNVNTKNRKQRVLSLRVRFHVFRSLTIFHGFVTIAWNAPRGVLAVLNLDLACMIEWNFLKELVPTVDAWPSLNLVKRWQKGFFVHLTISKHTLRKPTLGSCRCKGPGNVPLDFYVIEFSLKSSCLHPVFGPLFTPYPLFEWGPQSKEVLLNQGMKGWNSALNAQGSR